MCSLRHSPGHSQRDFLKACSGSGPPDGRGGLGEVGELKEEEPEHHRGGGWLDLMLLWFNQFGSVTQSCLTLCDPHGL